MSPSKPARVAHLPQGNADSAASLALTVVLPPGFVDDLIGRVRLACAEALDAQARPALLLSDDRLAHEVLGVSVKTLRSKLVPLGAPHLVVGGVRRWDPAAVLEWLRSSQQLQRVEGGE